jgi:hypothetical protein
MIQCISFNLNKLKDDRPILITHARAMCQVHHITLHTTRARANSKATCP